jgi:transcriptional regulator with GAF, ATPase, and Fis domain
MSTDTDTGEQALVSTDADTRVGGGDVDRLNRASGRSTRELVAQAAAARPDAVALVVDALSGSDAHGRDVTELLQLVVHTAKAAVPDCDSAGVTVVQEGTPFTSAWTDERTLAVDRDQYDVDDGPCLHAVREVTCVRVTVSEAMELWPDFTRAAQADGVRAFLAAPLVVDGQQFGALNLYSRSLDGFDDDDEGLAVLIGRIASGLVAGQLRQHRSASLVSQLEEAIASRAVIEQAKGAIAVVRQVTPDDAFGVLRTVSQDTNVKLREVAARTLREFGALLG